MKDLRRMGLVLACVVFIPLGGGCSGTSKNLAISLSPDCRGYDFDKKGPIKSTQTFTKTAEYNGMRKRLHNKDGFHIILPYNEEHPDMRGRTYNEDLLQSPMEQAYLAAYQAREQAFDAKYAAEIKAKLKAASDYFQAPGTQEYVLSYPVYLEKEQLPEGVVSPETFFHWRVFSHNIREQNLRKFIRKIYESESLSEKKKRIDLIKKGSGNGPSWEVYSLIPRVKPRVSALARLTAMEVSARLTASILSQVEARLKALYIEYVLTWYHLKEYVSPAARSEVARDLAAYYSDVAFRGAAESTHRYAYWLSVAHRCQIADFVARQVADHVLLMVDPRALSRFKLRYRSILKQLCYEQLQFARVERLRDQMSSVAYQQRSDELQRQVKSGRERCLND